LPSKQPVNPATTGIRRAIDVDAPAIAAILPQAATSQGAAERATFVLDDADGLIGVLLLSQSNDRLWIEAIAVSPDRLRQGHGKTLVAFAEAAKSVFARWPSERRTARHSSLHRALPQNQPAW